jgi:hypothetical protein
MVVTVPNALSLSGSGDPNDPYLIEDLADFDAFASDPNYWAMGVCTKLMCDLNLIGMTYTTAVIAPDGSPSFMGIFDGAGFVVRDLTIHTEGAGSDYLGLFGRILTIYAEVKNLGVENVTITGSDDSDYIGGLIGSNWHGQIRNCYATGFIRGGNNSDYYGGLVGEHMSADFVGLTAIINNCYAAVDVESGDDSHYLGGLVGYGECSYISNSHATGDVTADNSYYLGGLIGYYVLNPVPPSITDSYATGMVSGSSLHVGGLAGAIGSGIIRCYAAGPVNSGYNVGGLVGTSYNIISDCYAKGDVTGFFDANIGGLIGENNGTINNCYAAGQVAADSDYKGGLIGENTGTINDCFWDKETSELPNMCGTGTGCYDGVGRTTNQMKHQIIFDPPWDFTDTWTIADGKTYPYFQWEPLILCGDLAHPYPFGDVDQNCVVDMLDFAEMALHWLQDNRP